METISVKEEAWLNKEYITKYRCRSCDSHKMENILSLGDHKIVDFSEGNKPASKSPLTLALCDDCNLLQLRHTTRSDLMWGDDYGYKSGVNETMKGELNDIAQKTQEMVNLTANDIVIDIGCNDGTLLKAYDTAPSVVGFDPSYNVWKHARDHFVDNFGAEKYLMVNDYFKKEQYLRKYPEHSAKIITAIAMFYDLDEPNEFLQDVKKCLHPDGVFVIQQNYLKGMLDQLAFDNICHEHMEYYSLGSLEPLIEQNGLEIFDVSENDINGGSFRTSIRHQGSKVGGDNGSVAKMREDEKECGLDKKETYLNFAEKVKNSGKRLKEFVDCENKKGEKIYIYGASTRGGTLLQFCGIDNKQIIGAAERNPDKWGKTMKTTGIPIVSEEEARKKADIFLVLPWFFRREITIREQKFVEDGGRLVYPLPKLEVIG